MHVPFLDLKVQNAALEKEILSVWGEIVRNAAFVGGPQVSAFEEEFAEACHSKYAIAVNSGTDALRFAFMALEVAPGDEIITVPNTFIATTEAISQAGASIKFVDCDPDTYTLDWRELDTAVSDRTRGIVPVHLYGQPADMTPILDFARANGLWVVEDAAQAHLAEYHGKRIGSLGVISAFSFYPGKNLGACGEAGAVVTQDDELAQRIRMIRDHGQAQKYYHGLEGYNGRCDALQAAALRIKLRHLPEWNSRRRAHARQYMEELGSIEGVKLPKVLDGVLPVWHLFVILVENRDAVAAALRERGIATALHYPIPLHKQKAYAGTRQSQATCPNAERIADRLLSLPMYPELEPEQVSFVCQTLREVLATL